MRAEAGTPPLELEASPTRRRRCARGGNPSVTTLQSARGRPMTGFRRSRGRSPSAKASHRRRAPSRQPARRSPFGALGRARARNRPSRRHSPGGRPRCSPAMRGEASSCSSAPVGWARQPDGDRRPRGAAASVLPVEGPGRSAARGRRTCGPPSARRILARPGRPAARRGARNGDHLRGARLRRGARRALVRGRDGRGSAARDGCAPAVARRRGRGTDGSGGSAAHAAAEAAEAAGAARQRSRRWPTCVSARSIRRFRCARRGRHDRCERARARPGGDDAAGGAARGAAHDRRPAGRRARRRAPPPLDARGRRRPRSGRLRRAGAGGRGGRRPARREPRRSSARRISLAGATRRGGGVVARPGRGSRGRGSHGTDRARDADAALLERVPRRSALDPDMLARLLDAVDGLGAGLDRPGSSPRGSRLRSGPASSRRRTVGPAR